MEKNDGFVLMAFFAAVFGGSHLITYIAFVVASDWSWTPDFGVSITGWVMVELAYSYSSYSMVSTLYRSSKGI